MVIRKMDSSPNMDKFVEAFAVEAIYFINDLYLGDLYNQF